MKAIILARVSTEEQKEAGNSLPAQVERLKSYCTRKGFDVVRTFSFDESAYKTKRDEFDKILEYIKKSKEKIALCFDKVDRFSRNIFDKRVALLYELAMQGKVELHFASDNLVISKENAATENFHFSINLGLAKYYSDAIGDNVRRAFEQKRRNGEWTGRAPIGYKNVPLDEGKRLRKDIILDPDKAHLVQKLFEMYAQGKYSLKTLRDKSEKMGLKGMANKPLATSMIEFILKNPFYYGEAYSRTKNLTYEHKYPRLISRELFNQCQVIMNGWKKKPFQYAAKPFIFRGLLRCSHCGCSMSPEIKKGKHVYYACTNAKGACKRVYVLEKELLGPVYEVLERLSTLPQETIDKVVEELKKSSQDKNVYHNKAIASLQKEYNDIQDKVDHLVDFLVDGSITKDIYDRKLKGWKEKQYEINLRLEEHTRADESYYITAGTVLNLAKRAREIFDRSEVTEKRTLLNYLLQNSQVDGRKLEFSLRKPFDAILEYSNTNSMLRG